MPMGLLGWRSVSDPLWHHQARIFSRRLRAYKVRSSAPCVITLVIAFEGSRPRRGFRTPYPQQANADGGGGDRGDMGHRRRSFFGDPGSGACLADGLYGEIVGVVVIAVQRARARESEGRVFRGRPSLRGLGLVLSAKLRQCRSQLEMGIWEISLVGLDSPPIHATACSQLPR